MMECGEGGALFAAATFRNFGPWGIAAGAAWSAMARAVGTAGERAVQAIIKLDKNTQAIKDTISGKGVIPDFLTNSVIAEVKNTSYVSYSQQIRDMVDWATRNNLTFQLWVREGAEVSKTIRDLAAQGLIQLRTFVWP
jgi:hypothetical protein